MSEITLTEEQLELLASKVVEKMAEMIKQKEDENIRKSVGSATIERQNILNIPKFK